MPNWKEIFWRAIEASESIKKTVAPMAEKFILEEEVSENRSERRKTSYQLKGKMNLRNRVG